jgi:hypothetical protein
LEKLIIKFSEADILKKSDYDDNQLNLLQNSFVAFSKEYFSGLKLMLDSYTGFFLRKIANPVSDLEKLQSCCFIQNMSDQVPFL